MSEEDRNSQSLSDQVGSPAALAGVGVPMSALRSTEAIATLKSRNKEFILANSLEPYWLCSFHVRTEIKADNPSPMQPPWPYEAVEYFYKHILRVLQGREASLLTLVAHWKELDVARDWAGKLVIRVNEKLRKKRPRERKAKR